MTTMTGINKRQVSGLILLCVSLTFTVSSPGQGRQSPREKHKGILEHLEKGEMTQVEEGLDRIEAGSSQLFEANSYGYLRGIIRQRLGNLEAAAQDFLKLVERKAILSQYALWHLSKIAKERGELRVEQQYLERLSAAYPQSILVDRARWRVAQSYREDHNYPKALATYQAIARETNATRRRARLEIGEVERLQGKAFEARKVLGEVLAVRPSSDTALRAARALDAIDQQVGTAHRLKEHLQRARVYQANRAFEPARRHYRWILGHFPASPAAAEALWSIGLGYYRQEQYDKAIAWFRRTTDQYPDTPEGEQAAYWIGHAHARAGRWLRAVTQYEKFIAGHPVSKWVPGAHLNAIDALRSLGRQGPALDWCQRTIRRFPGELAATTALFMQARIHLVQGHYQAALEDFEALLRQNLRRRGPRAPNRAEVTFMRGYCQELLGRFEEAVETYLSLPDERGSYYGHRATARLHSMRQNREAERIVRTHFESFRRKARMAQSAGRFTSALGAATQALRLSREQAERSRWLDAIRRMYARLPKYRRWNALRLQRVAHPVRTRPPRRRRATHGVLASELIFLGLYDEGVLELAAALRPERRRLSRSQLYTLAVMYARGGYPDKALQIGEAYFVPRIPRDYRLELLPGGLAKTLYPVPYRGMLARQALQRGLDPRFVLALIREESRFAAGAKSSAAARGLMQFIPSTAERLAAAAGKDDFVLDDLYHPETSIQLGVAHLQELWETFHNNLFAVAAAYNAGDESVRRWLARARSTDPDRFVIEIGFRETKEYVYRVMASYWAYQQFISKALE